MYSGQPSNFQLAGHSLNNIQCADGTVLMTGTEDKTTWNPRNGIKGNREEETNCKKTEYSICKQEDLEVNYEMEMPKSHRYKRLNLWEAATKSEGTLEQQNMPFKQ